MIKEWFSTREIVDLNLKGLPRTTKSILQKAKREGWKSRERKVSGGGKEYHYSSLPETAKIDLVRKLAPKNEPKQDIAIKKETKDLVDWQRKILTSRLAVLTEVERIAQDAFGGRILKAEAFFSDASKNNELEDWLACHVDKAVQTSKTYITAASLRKWRTDMEKHGKEALIPQYGKRKKSPKDYPWLGEFLKHWQLPTKPSISQIHELLSQQGVELPSLNCVQKIIRNMPLVKSQKGRMLSREMKNIKAFKRRSVDNMSPFDVFTADGHKADIEIYDPASKNIFRPEIISILDAKTRLCVGFWIDTDEKEWLVAAALRSAVKSYGVPAVFYVDNGCGFKNKLLCGETTGILTQLGITPSFSLPYNSQAKGMIEKFNQMWIRAAKTQLGYVGVDMDKEARQRMFKKTRADIKEAGKTDKLMTIDEFVLWAKEQVEAYNNRPHSGLEKIHDELIGKLRFSTPNEALQQALDDGFKPVRLTAEQTDQLFLPQTIRMVRRGEIQHQNNIYFNPVLEDYHMQSVKIGYDIHDQQYIQVRTMEGLLICEAEIDGNKTDMFDQNYLEAARAKRTRAIGKSIERQSQERRLKGRKQRLAVKIDSVEEEFKALGYEEPVEEQGHDPVNLEAGRKAFEKLQKSKERPTHDSTGRPIFDGTADYVRWCLNNPDQLGAGDHNNLKEKLNSKTSISLIKASGIDIDAVRKLVNSLAAA